MKALASVGLAVGGILGMAGTFAPTAALRGVAWGIDGTALIMASAVLTVVFLREGQDMIAAGVSGVRDRREPRRRHGCNGADRGRAVLRRRHGGMGDGPRPDQRAASLPLAVRLLGMTASLLLAVTALQILAGARLTPITTPLPFFAYPFLVATMAGWIWTLLRRAPTPSTRG
jgi:hypothetical protein